MNDQIAAVLNKIQCTDVLVEGGSLVHARFRSPMTFCDLSLEIGMELDETGIELIALIRMSGGWSAHFVYNPEATAQLQAVTA